MREGRPSTTAAAVALARGVARIAPAAAGLAGDPMAEMMLTGLPAALLRAVQAASGLPGLSAALSAISLGLVDHIALRTDAIDRALLAGLAAGARQLVILGAGLDARAFRVDALADVVAFEVDHPATQAYKRARARAQAPRAREVRFVSVDFERQRLGDELAAAGHDPSIPTFWIWEGVTPYLYPDAIHATIAAVRARSAASSRLATTYLEPEIARYGRSLALAGRAIVEIVGEPLRGIVSPADIAGWLGEHGLTVLDDSGPPDWARRAGFGSLRARTLPLRERLVVAGI